MTRIWARFVSKLGALLGELARELFDHAKRADGHDSG